MVQKITPQTITRLHVSGELFGNTEGINRIAFSPDGKHLAASSHAEAAIWDVATSTIIQTLLGHQGEVWDIKFTPDATRLVTCADDKTVRVWNATSGELLATLYHQSPVMTMDISPDGTLIASGTEDGQLYLWSGSEFELIAQLPSRHLMHQVRFAPDGSLVATCENAGSVTLWDVAEHVIVDQLHGHRAMINGFCFDDQQLATCAYDKTLRVWDIQTRQALRVISVASSQIWGVQLQGDLLLCLTIEGEIHFYDGDMAIHRVESAHKHPISAMVFSPDGTQLASCDGGGVIRLWQT